MKALLLILTILATMTSCKKEASKEIKKGPHVLLLSFELETIDDGDKIIIETVGVENEYTIYHDLKVGLNKVEYTVSNSSGQLKLKNQDKDGSGGTLDYLFYNVSSYK